ncbi:MAG: flagellar basal body P-ring formation protein FlgA [Alphaproteobacteria bacterium]|nr:flagellar basal body P-ring formation protein FlgA [Alphaproteobacteria bacterium]
MRIGVIALALLVALPALTQNAMAAGTDPESRIVLARDVRADDILTEADLTLVNAAGRRWPIDAIDDASAIVGMAAKRRMPAGEPLRPLDLRRPIVVRKGDFVVVSYETAGLSLTAHARAMENASKGDVISLVNNQSHRSIEARVVGPNRAIIETQATIGATSSAEPANGAAR